MDNKRLKSNSLPLVMVCLFLANLLSNASAYSNNLILPAINSEAPMPYVYAISVSGSTYFAKNQSTGSVIRSSSNASYLINSLVINGSAFIFEAGTYQIDTQIKVAGNLKTIFSGKGPSTILNMAASCTTPIFLVSSNGSTVLKDMQIQNLNPSVKQKLIQLLSPAANVQLTNLVLNDMGPSSSDAMSSWGYPTPIQNVQVTGCQISAPNAFGVYFHYTHNAVVDGCSFPSVGWSAVGSHCQSRNITVKNNVVEYAYDTAFDFEAVDKNYPNYSTWTYSITNNTINSTGGSAIFCINTHDGVISGNVIQGCTGACAKGSGIVFATNKVVALNNNIEAGSQITGNVITNTFNGIYAFGQINCTVTGLLIQGNIISNCQYVGIKLGGAAKNFSVTGNSITDVSQAGKGLYAGIWNDGGSYADFSGNTITDSEGRLQSGYLETGNDYNSITGNVFPTTCLAVNISSGKIHSKINNNQGYNPIGIISNPVSGSYLVNTGGGGQIASNVKYTNLFTAKTVQIMGGAVSSVQLNGNVVYSVTNCTITLQPLDTLKVVWTKQPTITVTGQ